MGAWSPSTRTGDVYKRQIPGRIIPLPSEITAGCGLGWRMLPEDWEAWNSRLDGAGYDLSLIHILSSCKNTFMEPPQAASAASSSCALAEYSAS